MNNIHLYPSSFENESRIEKQVSSLSNAGLFDSICLIGCGKSKPSSRVGGPQNIKLYLIKKENKKPGIHSKIVVFFHYYLGVMRITRKWKIACINCHSLSALPLGYMLKLLHGSKLIYDAHELETETNGTSGVRKIFAKLIERILISQVDHVFVVSENIADWYERTYAITRPTVIFNAPKSQNIEKSDVLRKRLGIEKNKKIFIYQGVMNHGRGINKLLDVFQGRADNKAVLVLMGYGALVPELKSRAQASKNIFFQPAVPPREVLKYTSSADVGVALIENTCLSYYFCMPNKLFEYMMAGLPVLTSNMKEMNDFIIKHNAGEVVDIDSISTIDSAIDRLIESDLADFEHRNRKVALAYAWQNQAAKMIEIYKTIL